MSVETIVAEYKELLLEKVEKQKSQLDIDAQIRVIELKIELMTMQSGDGGKASIASETEQFIAKHTERLESDDFEFLQQEYRNTQDVVDHTAMSASTLRRIADSGKIESKRVGKGQGHRHYKTVSVMEFLIDAKAEEES